MTYLFDIFFSFFYVARNLFVMDTFYLGGYFSELTGFSVPRYFCCNVFSSNQRRLKKI